MNELHVAYRGRELTRRTINERMDAADPGTWGLNHSLLWSCPTLAGYAADGARMTFGPAYTVTLSIIER